MALRKAIQSAENQHIDTYWRVGSIAIEDLHDQARVVLVGYPNAEARATDKRRVNQSREFVIRGEVYQQLSNAALQGTTLRAAIFAAVYGYIKAAPRVVGGVEVPSEFADAVSV